MYIISNPLNKPYKTPPISLNCFISGKFATNFVIKPNTININLVTINNKIPVNISTPLIEIVFATNSIVFSFASSSAFFIEFSTYF